jgi:hypothetical protein
MAHPADRLNALLDAAVTPGGVAGVAVVTKDSGAPAVATWRPRDLDREDVPPPWRRPVYGLGLMGDQDSPLGPLWGHNGSGPGYEASVFATIAPAGKPRAAAAICAMEGTSTAETLVRGALAVLRSAAWG